MDRLLKLLNTQQREAVTTPSRYTQIVAGPGTGKTTTLAAKILYTQSELGILTNNILGISFSRSAKSHLLNKMEEFTTLIGYGGKPVILTFHSLAFRIIKYGIHFNESLFRQGVETIHTENFIDLDPLLTKGLCSEYADRKLVNESISQAYNLIRQGSLEASPVTNWRDIPQDVQYPVNTYTYGRILIRGRDLATFWRRINKIKKIKNTTDFQGLISEATRILSLKQRTYHHVSERFRHIFVDEYQDTSLAQEGLLLRLIDRDQTVTVVGDKNQTIYTFNGSNSTNMDRFSDYCKKYAPESSEVIHLTHNYRSTREIIHVANEFIGEETITPVNKRNGIKPMVVETHSIQLAAEFIAKKISELVEDTTVSLSDICILYRKNSEHSPQADKVFEQLGQYSIRYDTEQQHKENTESLIGQVLKVRDEYEDEPLEEVFEKLKLKNASKELLQFMIEVMNQGGVDTDDLTEHIVEIKEEAQEETSTDSITIKTVHEAKGLEYPIVFILYLGDREFPHSSRPNIEEEKRLLYVGMTRAQNQLYVLGKKGIEFEGFLNNCIDSDTTHIHYYSSIAEEKNEGFNKADKDIIDQTVKQQEEAEKKIKDELRRLMDFF
ncbi:ATP-dependent helicase [Rossellomorea marisflavi]|uniref:ATP-dependent helicase n=1 Tax=Rossellomorea marisflavi TaxID=189381 RepID=UPI0006A9C75C|nr:ATP-dependent helicase [Rossellomorea marisflavi]